MPTPCLDLTNPTDYWHALHQQQSDWALRAYARLVSTLSADVQDKLRSTAGAVQPYVVIFGKTQVGKTTLLLDLMGVVPAQMSVISQVLRGGRETGKSATATAMEYCRSTSERWGLDMPGSSATTTQWLDSDADVSAALGQLRTTMESGQLPAHAQPCVVHIPKRFFADAPSAVPQVRILDLPGDNPANPAEQQHVERMAHTYLPFADLILLVGRGDDLGFLQPSVITLPGIEDWQAMPRRFRVVTTYSYYAKNIKDMLRADMHSGLRTNAAQLRQRLRAQIETFSPLSPAAQDAELYFPLEFGTSWHTLAQTEPDLHAHLAPLIAQLRTALLQDIASATTPLGRLRSTRETHHSVKYLREKKLSAIEQELEALDKEEKNISANIEIFKKSITCAKKHFQNLINELENNTLQNGTTIIHAARLESPNNSPLTANSQENRESLREILYQYRHALQNSSLAITTHSVYWRKIRHALQAPKHALIEKGIEDALFSIRTKLDDYWLDKYFKTASYQADKEAVERAGNAAKQQLTQLWRNAWLAALQTVHQKLHNSQLKVQSEISIYQEEKEKLCRQLASVHACINALHSEQLRIERNTQKDLQRCEEFDILLNEEYAASLHQKMKIIFTTDDDCAALLQLFSCVELKNQHDAFMQTHSVPHSI